MSHSSTPLKRAKRATFATLAVYSLLVATHLGEFWPFSIYPMFSRGGHAWVRTVIRDVTEEDSVSWEPVELDHLPGQAFAMNQTNVNQNDVANFVGKSTEWSESRIRAMRSLFDTQLKHHRLMVFRVDGILSSGREVAVTYEPVILMAPDTTMLGPRLLGGVSR